jgi:tripartite ATP-independent transporter DctM subunit
MGLMLERSKLAEDLLNTLGAMFGPLRGGLAIGVTIVGTLLAASTGVVGATVVTMGLLALPTMLKNNYSAPFACGSICAAGTLGQLIPPSIVLILLADQVSSAYRTGQMAAGNMMPDPVSVLDLFAGAIVPGFLLAGCYIAYQVVFGLLRPDQAPPISLGISGIALFLRVLKSLVPPLVLIVTVLGSILGGIATATEAAAMGALGAIILAVLSRRMTFEALRGTMLGTMQLTAMIFAILIGAALFSLVFRGLGGDDLVHELLANLPGGAMGAILFIMIAIFLLGFFVDFIEIIFIVIPVIGPPLFKLDVDPVWFSILMAINLQTSFLTPPFGFALFYLQGVASAQVHPFQIYRGVVPFVAIQIMVLVIVILFPSLATWLPRIL